MARNLWSDIQRVAKAEISLAEIANPSRMLRLVLMAREIFRAIRNDNAFTLATALAYKTLAALVPILAVSLAIVSLLETGAETGTYTDGLIQVIHDRLPEFAGKDQFVLVVREFASRAKAIGLVSTLVLFVISYSLLSSIEKAFNLIWQVTESRPFLSKLGAFLSTIIIVPMLMSLSVYFTAQLASITEGVVQKIPVIQAEPSAGGGNEAAVAPRPAPAPSATGVGEGADNHWVTKAILALSSAMVTIVAMTALIFLLPYTSVRPGPALVGGFVAGAFFEVAKYLFHYYALWVGSNYTEIYGPLSAFPVILLWLWVVWVILLVGAELAFVSQNYGDLAAKAEIEKRGIDSRLYLAVRVVLEVSEHFARGEDQENLSEVVAARLRVPPYTVRQIIDHLVKRGVLRRVAGRSEMLLPARDIHALTVRDVVGTMQADPLSVPASPDDPLRRMLANLFADADRATEDILGGVTFAELVRYRDAGEEERTEYLEEEPEEFVPGVDPDSVEGEILLADGEWEAVESEGKEFQYPARNTEQGTSK
jgi:membrane protein